MPNKEHIRLWIEALRSGKYTQGRGTLQYKGTFCCLGVSCEVAIENGLDIPKITDGSYVKYDGETAYMPQKVTEWFGFAPSDWSDPQVSPELGMRAVRANDELKWDFDLIADSLERMYLTDAV